MINYVRLIALAAIWGGSFLFMRIAGPILGSAWLVFGRVGIGAIFLLCVMRFIHQDSELRQNWKYFSIVAFFNSALPFFLFAEATKSLNTSQLSIVNATAPAWAYLIGICLNTVSFNLVKVLGLVVGLAGVFFSIDSVNSTLEFDLYGIGMALGAAFSYGVATNYVKNKKKIEPFANAFGSMVFATMLIAPTLPFFPIQGEINLSVILAVLAIGVVCSGFAYILYFKIIETMGATSALTVTYLIPLFGTFWGYWILDEPITQHGILGAVIVLMGTLMVTSNLGSKR
jgi:drug/metabolite transporter (DMT)-like permease